MLELAFGDPARRRSRSTASAGRSSTALVAAAVGVVLDIVFGTNDDDAYSLRVVQRIAKRQGGRPGPTSRGSSSSRSTASRCPCSGARCATGARPRWRRGWRAATHHLVEWEPDLSSQTGASQAGILLGSNDGHPGLPLGGQGVRAASIACSGVADCAEIEEAHATGIGLLVNGGSSRANLFSGEAEEAILTVEPDQRREARQPGLPRVLRQRVQRHADARAVLLGDRARVDGGAAGGPPRRAAARAPRRDVPAAAGGGLRRRPRPDRLRRPHRHDARPARGLRDVLELRRGRSPLRAGAGGHARGAAQARPAVRADRPRAPLRARARTTSSCSPTMARPRARRSCSGTATRWRSSSRARSTSGEVTGIAGGDEQSAKASLALRRGDRPGREAGQARGRGGPHGSRGRARLRQPRARLPHGGEAPAHARGDRRAASAADPGAPRASARRAGCSSAPREHGALALGARGMRYLDGRAGRGSRTRSRASRRTRRRTCCGPTASRTSRTSWSGASTTPTSTRAAHSRS